MGTGGNKVKRKIHTGQEDMKDIRTQRIPTFERISEQDSIPVKLYQQHVDYHRKYIFPSFF